MSIAPVEAHTVVRWCVIVAYAAAVAWIAVRAGSPTDLRWWIQAIPFFLWIVAPVAVPLLVPFRHWLLTGGVALMAAYGVYIYERDMFGPGARSTSALIFVWLPIYQWIGTAVLIVIASALSRRKLQ